MCACTHTREVQASFFLARATGLAKVCTLAVTLPLLSGCISSFVFCFLVFLFPVFTQNLHSLVVKGIEGLKKNCPTKSTGVGIVFHSSTSILKRVE